MVGLPTTGLGGVFYLLLALRMPVQELIRTLRGEGSTSRWRVIGIEMTLLAGIVVGIWAQSWLLSNVMLAQMLRADLAKSGKVAITTVVPGTGELAQWTILSAAACLVVLTLSIHFIRLALRGVAMVPMFRRRLAA